jgi:Na+-driven multidrug efflux pump
VLLLRGTADGWYTQFVRSALSLQQSQQQQQQHRQRQQRTCIATALYTPACYTAPICGVLVLPMFVLDLQPQEQAICVTALRYLRYLVLSCAVLG